MFLPTLNFTNINRKEQLNPFQSEMIREQKYIRQLLTDLKGEIDSNTIIVENVNTLLWWLDHPDRMSTRKQRP